MDEDNLPVTAEAAVIARLSRRIAALEKWQREAVAFLGAVHDGWMLPSDEAEASRLLAEAGQT